MKAAVLYANRDIRYDDWKDPVVKRGTVKVHVEACGICGSDIPRVLDNGAHFYPIVLGHEFSGVVTEIGDGVKKLQIGDRVSCAPLMPCMHCDDCQKGDYSLCKNYSFIGSREQGGLAEYVVIPEMNAVKFSESIDFEIAAMFEPATVALHGVLQNDFCGCDYTAVLGCGTIGIFTIQLAKIFGAKRVVAFDVDDGRLKLAKKMGADEAINSTNPNYYERAMQYSDGLGYKFVFEAAGNPITIKMSYKLVSNKGNVCCIGTPHKGLSFTPAEWEQLNRKEFNLTASWMSYSAPFPGKEWEIVADLLKRNKLKFDPSFIFRKFPLERVSEAFSLFENPENVHGKVMICNDIR